MGMIDDWLASQVEDDKCNEQSAVALRTEPMNTGDKTDNTGDADDAFEDEDVPAAYLGPVRRQLELQEQQNVA